MIPEGWQSKYFAEIADYRAGRTPARARSDYWASTGDGVPWIAISDMTDFGNITKAKEEISNTAFNQVFHGRTVPAGTLVMSFKLTIGRVATLGIDACHNEAIISIYPRKDVDQGFLGYFLSQVDYDSLQDRQVKGNTLNQEKIDRIEVWLPPHEQQLQISSVLSFVRRAIHVQEVSLRVTQDLKRAAMRVLFTRGLRGETQKETEIGPMPESWLPRTVLDLCEIWSGGTPRKSVADYWSGEIPWVSGKDLKSPSLDDAIDHITPVGVEAGSRLAPKGAVLLLVRGMGLAKDLPVAVINRSMAFNQDVKALVPRGELTGQFLRSAIYTSKHRLLTKLVPSAHGTMTLNLNDIETFKLPCPTEPGEADEIVAILDAIDRKIDLHRRKRAVLDELFKALLHKLMTGEIRVADLDLSALATEPAPQPAGAAA